MLLGPTGLRLGVDHESPAPRRLYFHGRLDQLNNSTKPQSNTPVQKPAQINMRIDRRGCLSLFKTYSFSTYMSPCMLSISTRPSNPITFAFGRVVPAASPYTHPSLRKEPIAWGVPEEADAGVSGVAPL